MADFKDALLEYGIEVKDGDGGCKGCTFISVHCQGHKDYGFIDLCIDTIGTKHILCGDFESKEEKTRVFLAIKALATIEVVHG